MRHRGRWLVAAISIFAIMSMAVGACGSSDSEADVELVLDYLPGGIHAGIYSALGEGYFADNNLNVDVQSPTSSADTLRLVLSGQASFGIAPIADVANLVADGEDIQVFMALEQVPLAALMSTEAIGVTDPSQLTGATIGVTGIPSDEAVAKTILAASGVDPDSVEFITIGFDAVGHLLGQTVDAAIGFWSAEAVVLELEGETPFVFRPDEYGAPPYPELVVFASADTINKRSGVVQRFYDSLAEGYEFALANQEAAIKHLADNAEGIDEFFSNAEFDKVEPFFLGPNGTFGEISDAAIRDYLNWAASVGILTAVPEDFITTEFLP